MQNAHPGMIKRMQFTFNTNASTDLIRQRAVERDTRVTLISTFLDSRRFLYAHYLSFYSLDAQ
jgi:hypothetical protein